MIIAFLFDSHVTKIMHWKKDFFYFQVVLYNFLFAVSIKMKGFYFSASTDVDKIKREMDYKTLQDNIMHITFCNIESEMVSNNLVIQINIVMGLKQKTDH